MLKLIFRLSFSFIIFINYFNTSIYEHFMLCNKKKLDQCIIKDVWNPYLFWAISELFYVESKNHCIALSWVICVMVYIHRKYINTIESSSFNQTINFFYVTLIN